jgi:Tfp pilus assembly protein PilV
MRAPAGFPFRLTDEAGFGLIEVLVSTLLLAIVALGVFAQIDGPAALSGVNKARSTAAALAQQDQERLRAMKTTDLSNYSATRTVTVGSLAYTVKSKSTWLSDASGLPSCQSNSTLASYQQIVSTVTWATIGAGKPVEVVSVIAPGVSVAANAGNLSVQLTDQAGAAMANVPVTVTPGSIVIPTNSAGCAFFGFLDAGNYSAAYAVAGSVDPSGASAINLSGSVTAGATTTLSGSLGQASQVTASFDTKVGAAAPVAAQATSLTAVNPGIPAPGFRQFTFASPQTSIPATSMYPFTSGYGLYTGTCGAANPTQYNATYYTTNPTRYANVTPGGSTAVTVREPALNVTVKRNSVAYANAHVIVTATGTGCTDKFTMSTDALGGLVKNASPFQAPAVPFGTYTVCADDGALHKATGAVLNTDPNGNQVALNTVVNISTFSTSSACT